MKIDYRKNVKKIKLDFDLTISCSCYGYQLSKGLCMNIFLHSKSQGKTKYSGSSVYMNAS